jgi:hypothetical protein
VAGCSVSSAGDVNKDGYDEILVGARGGYSLNGSAYLYTFYSSGGPSDINISIGSKNIWNRSGTFNTTETSKDFAQTLNDYLRASSSSYDEFNNSMVNVPINSTTISGGILNLFNLSVVYTLVWYFKY